MSAAALLLAAITPLSASERGFPLITVYPAEVHKAGPQTFDLAQDSRGVLHFGNLHGLVSYDGAWWQLLKLPDDQVALSVATDAKGRLAVGMVNDLGFVVQDPIGAPKFETAIAQLPPAARQFGDVRSICATAQGFLFVTERALITSDGTRTRLLASYPEEGSPRGCHADQYGVLLRGPRGLQHLDMANGRVTPTAITQHVTVILRLPDRRLILATRNAGLFELVSGEARTFAPEASEWLKGKTVAGGAVLPNGRVLFATRQKGLIILSAAGTIEQFLSEDAGLPDSQINDVRVDREGALWLAMDGPIVRVDLASPVTVFDVRRGVRGTANDVARFEGSLYAGTSHGLYRIDSEGHGSRLDFIPEGASRLIPRDGELLILSAKGISRLRSGGAFERLAELEIELYDVARSKDPSRLWVATGEGLGVLRRSGTAWQFEFSTPRSPEYISTVYEAPDGSLWCGSLFNGILKITNPGSPRQKVTQYGSGEANVFFAAGAPRFVPAFGTVMRVTATGGWEKDPLLGHFEAPRGFFSLIEDRRGNIWVNSTPPRRFDRQPDGSYSREGTPLVGVTAADIQTMRITSDGVVWFASDKGLFRYEPPVTEHRLAPQPRPLLRRVLAGDNRLLSAGGGGTSEPELPHNFGRIRIEFAPASYRPGVLYQYKLEPMDADWSNWTDQSFIDYTTLEPNAYRFLLRARGAAMQPSEPVGWQFSVAAPWYRTRGAWLAWFLLLAGAVALFIRVRTANLRRQAERLRARVAEKTAELQDAVQLLESANARLEVLSLEDDLTRIANRRYFERALADEWNRARRRQQPLGLILLDLDDFKELNDRRGHPAGDECLRRIGSFLAETIRRSGEVVARYGGEEFAILLPATDLKGAVQIAEVLRSGIERLDIPYGRPSAGWLTASCGVASLIPSAELTAEELVRRADTALYAAKSAGRNCVKTAEESAGASWLAG